MQLSSTNIGTVEVGNAIGLYVHDYGLLCFNGEVEEVGGVWQAKVPFVSADRINKWSLTKPIRNSLPIGINDINSAEAIKFFTLNGAGFQLPIWGENETVASFLSRISGTDSNYFYLAPRGGAYNEYFRIDDFRKYQPQIPILHLNAGYTNDESIREDIYTHNSQGEGTKSVVYTNYDTIDIQVIEGCLRLIDIYTGNENSEKLGNYYLTAFIYNEEVSKWYCRSLFKFSDIFSTVTASQPLEFLLATWNRLIYPTLALFTASGERYSNSYSINRYYCLTQNAVNNDVSEFQNSDTQTKATFCDLRGSSYPFNVGQTIILPSSRSTKNATYHKDSELTFKSYVLINIQNQTEYARTVYIVSKPEGSSVDNYINNGELIIPALMSDSTFIKYAINGLVQGSMYDVGLRGNNLPITYLFRDGTYVKKLRGETSDDWNWNNVYTTGGPDGGLSTTSLYIGSLAILLHIKYDGIHSLTSATISYSGNEDVTPYETDVSGQGFWFHCPIDESFSISVQGATLDPGYSYGYATNGLGLLYGPGDGSIPDYYSDDYSFDGEFYLVPEAPTGTVEITIGGL